MLAVKAVLLDMDGTLVDSDAAVERAWHRWAAEHDVAVEVLAPVLHGSPAARTIRTVLPDLDDAGVAAAAQRNLDLQYDDLTDVTALPGAARLLRTLDELGLPWAVVTSADRRLATVRLHAAGLTARNLVTVEDTPRGKPDPAPYLTGAALLGVDPKDCLVVEDAQPGIDAGRAAGMRVAALRGLTGDVPIRDLDDLADQFLR
ncbi:HAD-IA family hydrolase [Dactylosporangium aurantiacum]|uniref:HAD-IA family hydrolase n=1 Tax=Dactylosporangium aurantiacum TaxID=35754 RepID=A0A9Q9IFH4_9ACTN|nr:HAD-IA family hydrolase [Dactylosporangium aurantiacum]MDG6105071.1 HAD-IA family hydrolase [Dactylosporangium aurantiacum]UWZ51600.1 HAD-IA family hydrolase [Dactylosporangium aurantiacum]